MGIGADPQREPRRRALRVLGAVAHLGIVEHLVDAEHRLAADVLLAESLAPLRARRADEDALQPLHGVIGLRARGEGEVTELLDLEQLAQACPELGLERRHGDPAVRAAIHVVAGVRAVEQHRARARRRCPRARRRCAATSS